MARSRKQRWGAADLRRSIKYRTWHGCTASGRFVGKWLRQNPSLRPNCSLGVPKIRKIGPRFGMARSRKQGWGAADLRVSIKYRTWHGWTASGRFVGKWLRQNPSLRPNCSLGVPKIRKIGPRFGMARSRKQGWGAADLRRSIKYRTWHGCTASGRFVGKWLRQNPQNPSLRPNCSLGVPKIWKIGPRFGMARSRKQGWGAADLRRSIKYRTWHGCTASGRFVGKWLRQNPSLRPNCSLGVPKIRKIGPRFGMARSRKQGWGAADLRRSIKYRTWHGWTASGRFVGKWLGQNPSLRPNCSLGVQKIRKIGPRFGMTRSRKQGWGAADLRRSIKYRTWHGWTASGRFVGKWLRQNPSLRPNCSLGVPKIWKIGPRFGMARSRKQGWGAADLRRSIKYRTWHGWTASGRFVGKWLRQNPSLRPNCSLGVPKIRKIGPRFGMARSRKQGWGAADLRRSIKYRTWHGWTASGRFVGKWLRQNPSLRPNCSLGAGGAKNPENWAPFRHGKVQKAGMGRSRPPAKHQISHMAWLDSFRKVCRKMAAPEPIAPAQLLAGGAKNPENWAPFRHDKVQKAGMGRSRPPAKHQISHMAWLDSFRKVCRKMAAPEPIAPAQLARWGCPKIRKIGGAPFRHDKVQKAGMGRSRPPAKHQISHMAWLDSFRKVCRKMAAPEPIAPAQLLAGGAKNPENWAPFRHDKVQKAGMGRSRPPAKHQISHMAWLDSFRKVCRKMAAPEPIAPAQLLAGGAKNPENWAPFRHGKVQKAGMGRSRPPAKHQISHMAWLDSFRKVCRKMAAPEPIAPAQLLAGGAKNPENWAPFRHGKVKKAGMGRSRPPSKHQTSHMAWLDSFRKVCRKMAAPEPIAPAQLLAGGAKDPENWALFRHCKAQKAGMGRSRPPSKHQISHMAWLDSFRKVCRKMAAPEPIAPAQLLAGGAKNPENWAPFRHGKVQKAGMGRSRPPAKHQISHMAWLDSFRKVCRKMAAPEPSRWPNCLRGVPKIRKIGPCFGMARLRKSIRGLQRPLARYPSHAMRIANLLFLFTREHMHGWTLGLYLIQQQSTMQLAQSRSVQVQARPLSLPRAHRPPSPRSPKIASPLGPSCSH